jgi:hypothetical protein
MMYEKLSQGTISRSVSNSTDTSALALPSAIGQRKPDSNGYEKNQRSTRNWSPSWKRTRAGLTQYRS